MQKIERYGVIALVFLLVTILAVSLWGESKDGGLMFWKKDAAKDAEQASVERPRPRANGANRGLLGNPLRNEGAQRPVAGGLELSTPSEDPTTPPAAPRLGFVSTDPASGGALTNPNAARPTPPAQPNPSLIGGTLPNPSADVAVPVGAGTLVRGAQPQQQPLQPNALQSQPQAPATLPARNTSRTYVVKSGDTLGGIASRELGSTARWTEIQALNGGIDPKRVREGMTLRLPAGAAAETNRVTTPASTPTVANAPKASGGKYTIRSGDTLSAIASRELGDGERWREIAALNPSLDPTRLSVGAVIALPTGRTAGASNVANAPRLDDRQVVAYGPAPKGKSGVQ